MSKILEKQSEKLNSDFDKKIKKEISNLPDTFKNKKERDFLMNLEKYSNMLLKKVEENNVWSDEETLEIKYKLKINILNDLNIFLKEYPTLKSEIKLDALVIIQKIWSDLKSLKADIITGNKTIMPDEFLKDADIIGFDHISEKIEKADSWDIKTLIEKTKDIEIESQNITSDDFDNFIDDLDVPSNSSEKTKFESAIKKFKESKIYKESETTSLISWVTDNFNWLNIKSIWTKIDDIIDNIIEKEKDNKKVWKIELKIEWLDLTFNSNEEALRAFYKIKLILSSLSKEDQVWLFTILWNITSIDYYASEGVDEVSNLVWGFPIIGWLLALVITAWWYGALWYLNIKPIWNAIRHSKDVVTLLWWKTLREWRNKDTFLWRWAKRFSYNYIDPVSSDTKISVFDFNENAWDLEEQDTRRKILELARRVSKGNKVAEVRLKELTDTFHLSLLSPIWGDISSESESFWRKIYAIVNETSIWGRILTWFSATSYKQKIIEWQNETLKNQKESAKLIFSWIGAENAEKTIDELKFKSDFENLIHNIDLWDGLSWSDYISHSDEIERTNNIKELIRKVKDLEIFISPENLKWEILKVIKWYYPNSLALEKVRGEFKDILSKTEVPGTDAYKKQQNIKNFLNSIKDLKWIWNIANLTSAISEIKTWVEYTSLTWYDINANNDYTWTRLEKEYDKLIKQWEELSKKDFKTMSW